MTPWKTSEIVTTEMLPSAPAVSTTVTAKKPLVAPNRWKQAFFALLIGLALASVGAGGWRLYWLERWQSETLWQVNEQQKILFQFLQKNVTEGRLK